MASYTTGGSRSVGGHAVGRREAGGWLSLGDATLWTGNIMEHVYECYEMGAYTGTSAHVQSPTAINNILQIDDGVYFGYYMNMYEGYDEPDLQSMVFCLSEDGTPATIYSRTGFTPSLEMKETAEFDYMYPYLSTDNQLHIGWGMSYNGLTLATEPEVYKIIGEGGGALLSPPLDIYIRRSDGTTIDEEELEMIPDSSTPAWGGGNYDNDSTPIPVPNLPILGAHNCGFLTVYNPSISELQNFANYLWSNDVFDTIKKFIASPMELIVSLSVVPVAPIAGSTSAIKIGGIDSGVGSTIIANQYMNVNCGTLNINEYFGSALDYGYTKISIFLPYIGVREIKADEVMGGAVNVQYNIDLVSGTCVAFISCFRQGLGAVLYSFEGNMATQIPIMSRDFSSIYTALARGVVNTALSGGSGVVGSALQSAISVMSNRPTVSRAGNFSSNAGLLGIAKPYVIIERPIQSDPKDSPKFYGRPSNITATLGSLHGYTEVEEVFLDGLTCTDEERELVQQALEEGTIF